MSCPGQRTHAVQSPKNTSEHEAVAGNVYGEHKRKPKFAEDLYREDKNTESMTLHNDNWLHCRKYQKIYSYEFTWYFWTFLNKVYSILCVDAECYGFSACPKHAPSTGSGLCRVCQSKAHMTTRSKVKFTYSSEALVVVEPNWRIRCAMKPPTNGKQPMPMAITSTVLTAPWEIPAAVQEWQSTVWSDPGGAAVSKSWAPSFHQAYHVTVAYHLFFHCRCLTSYCTYLLSRSYSDLTVC